jgi:hypothetical protein
MVEGLVAKEERARLGKTNAHMSWQSGYDEFCNSLSALSTAGYNLFRHYFGGRTVRSQRFVYLFCLFFHFLIPFRAVRAKLPKFEAGISVNNIKHAADVLKRYNYNGPLILAWDDTSLEPGLSLFQKSKGEYVIVGSSTGSIVVSGPEAENIDAIFEIYVFFIDTVS